MSSEYIGQLEGEVTAKADEATALRAENRQLREENTRLTDLTRMLLSSQSFAGFLQELSQGNVPEGSRQQPRQERTQQPQQTQQTTQPPTLPKRKDVNPHEAARQLQNQQPQVGMALIPEAPIDMSLYDTPSWTQARTTDYHVFSVTEVPQGPCLETAKLLGKTEQATVLPSLNKKMIPSLPQKPAQRPSTLERNANIKDVKCAAVPLGPMSSPISSPKLPVQLLPSPSQRVHEHEDSLGSRCSELEETLKRLSMLIPGL
jgi:bZIP-type transcription factor MBZ1